MIVPRLHRAVLLRRAASFAPDGLSVCTSARAPPKQPVAAQVCSSGSCRCAMIDVPWCLRRLSLFSTLFEATFSTNKSTQAQHAETDPGHCTLRMGILPTA